jgi:hypothetical protein
MSYAAAGGRNEPVQWQYLDLWNEGTSSLFRVLYIVWYVSCFGFYCTHDTWHKGTLRDWSLIFNWAVPRTFLQWHLVKFPCRQSRTTGGPSSLLKWSSVGTVDCLVFCSWDESQTLYKYEVRMCVCVCHMMLWGQPAQQQVDVYAHFQFLQPLYSCFVFSKSLTHMVNLFWLFLCNYKTL